MNTVCVGDFKRKVRDFLHQAEAGAEFNVVGQDGKTVFAIVNQDTFDLLESIERAADESVAKKALTEIEQEGCIPWNEAKEHLDRSRSSTQ